MSKLGLSIGPRFAVTRKVHGAKCNAVYNLLGATC